MKISVLENFVNKQVEITAGGKVFTGLLRLSDLGSGVIEILPTNEYSALRYDSFILQASSIVAVKLIVPRPTDMEADDDAKETYGDEEMGTNADSYSDYLDQVKTKIDPTYDIKASDVKKDEKA